MLKNISVLINRYLMAMQKMSNIFFKFLLNLLCQYDCFLCRCIVVCLPV